MRMIDPKSGFIINIEIDENQSSSSVPCLDLANTSDEASITEQGASKDTKRWCKTDKQEWWKIYQDYMQDRLKRKPRPLDVRGGLGKDIIIRRDGFRRNGRPKKFKQGSPEDDMAEYLNYNDSNNEITVENSLRRRTKRDLAGVTEHSINKKLEQAQRRLLKDIKQNMDLGSPENTRFEEIWNTSIKVESVSDYDRIETSFDEVDENTSESCPVNTSNADGAIYLELEEELDDDSDPNTNDGNADIEEYEDVQYLNEDFISQGTVKRIYNKKSIVSLRQNSLKLLKHSNICPFKWTKHYFMCYVCRQLFKNMHTLRSHMKDSHNYGQVKRKMAKEKDAFSKVDITDLKCTICSVILNSLSELENHLADHNVLLKAGGTSLIPYKVCTESLNCQLCGDGFATRYRLQRHMDGHFINYICPECNKGFPNLSSLKKHRRKHKYDTSDNNLKYVKRKSKESETRFKCSLCPEKFSYDYKRLQHMIEDHNKDIKLFECQFCPRIFMTLHWLTKHTICVHKEQL